MSTFLIFVVNNRFVLFLLRFVKLLLFLGSLLDQNTPVLVWTVLTTLSYHMELLKALMIMEGKIKIIIMMSMMMMKNNNNRNP